MTKIDTIGRRQRATLPRHARVRVGKREVTDPAEAWAVIDAARIAHVGFVADDRPMVIPMLILLLICMLILMPIMYGSARMGSVRAGSARADSA